MDIIQSHVKLPSVIRKTH